MKKFTAGLAATFAFTSLFLTLLSDRTGLSSVTSRAPSMPAPASAEAPKQQPSSPAAADAYNPISEKPADKKSEPAKK